MWCSHCRDNSVDSRACRRLRAIYHLTDRHTRLFAHGLLTPEMWPLAMASCCRPFIFEAGVVCFALTPLTIEATTSMKFRRKTCLRSMLINVSSTSNP